MQWGITQTSSSRSSSTLLPCNFSAECPTHLPHITALSLTPPTPWKTLHASTYTATWPKYTAPLSLLLSACSDTLYALATAGFPLSYLLYVCVCVHKCFLCAPYCAAFLFFFPLQFVWDQQKDINHCRDYYNLHFNLLAANVKAGRGVARFRASASGKEEAETVDLGATVWRSVTSTGPDPVNTSSHSVTETQRRRRAGCVWTAAASMGPVRVQLSLLLCL